MTGIRKALQKVGKTLVMTTKVNLENDLYGVSKKAFDIKDNEDFPNLGILMTKAEKVAPKKVEPESGLIEKPFP